MFVSVPIVLCPQASAGLRVTALDGACSCVEYHSAVASYFPDCVPGITQLYKFEECYPVNLLPGQILKVSCVCH